MKTLSLILAALALAAPARADWKLTACKKACIPPHDSRVVECKTLKTKEGKACLERADKKRRQCELECERPALVPTVPASTGPTRGAPAKP